MSKISVDTARLPLLLHELRLPAINRLWQDIATRADKEGWPAIRFLSALAEIEVAERARRRIERHLAESLAAVEDGHHQLAGAVLQPGPQTAGQARVEAGSFGRSIAQPGQDVTLTRSRVPASRVPCSRVPRRRWPR